MKKVNAFTLSEMVIALIITAIVVGLTFSILGLIQNQIWAIEKNYERRTEVNLLRQALWIDFSRCSKFDFDAVNNTMEGSNPIKKVTYTFKHDFILRDKDTFKIKLKKKVFYFDGVLSKDGNIDALELITDNEKGSGQLFIYKNNAAATYMN